jgi:hypothetical protein
MTHEAQKHQSFFYFYYSTTSDKFRSYANFQLNEMINLYWQKYCQIIRSRFEAEVYLNILI